MRGSFSICACRILPADRKAGDTLAVFEWMQMRRYSHSCSDDNEVLDDVLTFECGYEKALPCFLREKDKWSKRGNHMEEQQWYNDALETFDQKEYADETFKHAKTNQKNIKRHKRYCFFKQSLNNTICLAGTEDF